MDKFQKIADDFSFLDDWEDRYRYLIELGQNLRSMPDALKSDKNKVSGCVSQVWVHSEVSSGENDEHKSLEFVADSDAMIVKGIIALLIALYSGKDAKFIAETDAIAMLDKIGLREHLTAQRSNGLVAMVKRMRSDAEALL